MYVPIEQWPNKELSKSQQLIPKLCHPRNWHETSQINDICKVLKWLSVLPVWYFVWVPIKASVPMGNEILQYKYPCYVTVYRCIDITFSLCDFYISNDGKLQVIFNCFNYLMWVDKSRLHQSKARWPGLRYKQLVLKN